MPLWSIAGYSPYMLLWLFLLYSFLGWCCEVVFCTVNTGQLVNRGFLNGPVCPIYGFGGLSFVLLLGRLENLLLIYLGSVLLASALELLGGYLLKKAFHTSWWDYSDEPFNLGGYICLKFSLLWGLAGVVLLRAIQPILEGLVSLLPPVLGWVALAFLYTVFVLDLLLTVAAVRRLDSALGELTRLAQGIHKGSDALSEGLGTTALKMSEKVEQLDLPAQKQQAEERWKESREKVALSLEEGKEKAAAAWEEGRLSAEEALQAGRSRLQRTFQHNAVRTRLQAMAGELKGGGRRLLRAFPNMKNNRYTEALSQLKSHLAQGDAPREDSEKPSPQENTCGNAAAGAAPEAYDGKGADDLQ